MIILAMGILSGCGSSKKQVKTVETPPKPGNPPKEQVANIVFDEPVIDFGKVVKGETRTHDFSFTNTGNAPLVIEIATGCSCTTIDYPTQAIMPGEKGHIRILFDSGKKKPGPVSVDIDVIANTKPIVTTATFNAEVIDK